MIFFRRFSLFLGVSPACYLSVAWYFDWLSANAIEDFIHQSGQWSFFFLFLTLLVTPLTRHIPLIELRSMRRQWGLFCCFYALLHLSVYVVLDFYFAWEDIYYDIIENKYIIVGLLATLILCLLATTSTRFWRRKLKSSWQKLHNLVYVIFILAILHFYWLTKADYTEPALYSALITSLLLERIWHRYQTRKKKLLT